MRPDLTSEEVNDIVNALREKARGDMHAANYIDHNNATKGMRRLKESLIAQSARQEKLADRLEE